MSHGLDVLLWIVSVNTEEVLKICRCLPRLEWQDQLAVSLVGLADRVGSGRLSPMLFFKLFQCIMKIGWALLLNRNFDADLGVSDVQTSALYFVFCLVWRHLHHRFIGCLVI